ncbi:MAG: endoglucanase [Blastocatellia bacterium]|nr:endoglucanase [Blastocatellia bacterium]
MKISLKVLYTATALVLLLWSLGANAQTNTNTINLTVDAASNWHLIDPNIYGMAGYGLDATYAEEIDLPNFRWGGDATTRYNWKVDSSNSGKDWYYVGGSGVATPTPGGQVDTMINTYHPAGARPLITIPIIPYINSTSQYTCSYRESVYGPQPSYDPYLTVAPDNDKCGNGLDMNGNQIFDSNIYYNHTDNSPSIQYEWVQHLVSKFGTGPRNAIHYFQLDNEPGGWGNTHVDVMPNGANYPTIVQLGEEYASAIKEADFEAKVFGPSDFTLGGWVGDTSQQDGLLAGQYYLKQFAAYDEQIHRRTLDYFDEHYYGNGGSDPAELQTTRAFWDPTYNSGSWVEQYIFGEPMQLIPRFHSWINQYYPGTRLSLSEYSMTNGGSTIYDALTEADTLGIFGREGVDFANLWTVPAPSDPVAYSFRLFRNYDGNGGKYGDLWVNSVSDDQTQLAVYSAVRIRDLTLTMIVINKTDHTISSTLSVKNFFTLASRASAYLYSGANLTAIVPQPVIPLQRTRGIITGLETQFPAYSATVIAIPAI